MVRQVVARYPTTKIICIGFSMGGNIVTKYLGERKSIPQIIAGISACQVREVQLSIASDLHDYFDLSNFYIFTCFIFKGL